MQILSESYPCKMQLEKHMYIIRRNWFAISSTGVTKIKIGSSILGSLLRGLKQLKVNGNIYHC